MTPKILIRLQDVNVSLNGQTVLRRISWQLKEKENWALFGANGSGKTTLLNLIRGDLWPDPTNAGRRIYAFDHSEQHSPVGICERIAIISPEIQDRYLQQDWDLDGETIIHTGFFNSVLLYQRPKETQRRLADAIIASLRLGRSCRKNVQEMSTGELRKVLIARAMVSQPKILILDEFCDGLDAESRRELLALVEDVARSGTQILYATHRAAEIIPAITHVLVLDRGEISRQAPREESPFLGESGDDQRRRGFQPVQSGRMPERRLTTRQHTAKPASAYRSRRRDEADARTRRPGSVRLVTSAATGAPDFLIRIANADVFRNRKRILHDINWQMNADENWGVLGKNGSGKSTLIKLIYGDLDPAFGGKIQRFDRRSQRTIWQTKNCIGCISADFQANYREELTGEEVVASGFFSSVGLLEKPSWPRITKVRKLIRRFGLNGLAKKSILRMSYGELRKLLLLRAFVNAPKLLLLDEPFDGLDTKAKAQMADALERLSRNGTRLIVVTHHWNDLPRCITHALYLNAGRIVAQGKLERPNN